MAEIQTVIETLNTTVSEITSDPGGLVPLSAEILANVVSSEDAEPKFATYVIESGWSKSNRFWGPELFGKVASEINAAASTEPYVGYMGHITPEKDAYEFPDIQLEWVGAKLISAGDQAKLAVKAYILPGTKAREYADKKKGRFINSVSWKGKIAQEIYQQGVRVKEFAIESIDLARPRTAGMNARLVALTSEMETEEISVKPEEISALQENELRAHNPNLVQTIEAGVKTPLETKVSEMTAEADAAKPKLDLIVEFRKLLGLDDNTDDLSVLQSAVESIRKQGKKLRDTILDSVLEKKFRGQEPTLLRRVIVGEMTNISLTGDTDKDEKAVSEMVDNFIDGDENLKRIVSEMESTPVSPPTTGDDRRTGKTEFKAGTETSTLRVQSVA